MKPNEPESEVTLRTPACLRCWPDLRFATGADLFDRRFRVGDVLGGWMNLERDEERRPLAAADLHDAALLSFVAARVGEVGPRLNPGHIAVPFGGRVLPKGEAG